MAEDKTLPATERRRQRARSEGQAPLSREIVACSGLATGALLLSLLMPSLSRSLSHDLQAMLVMRTPDAGGAFKAAGWAILSFVVPIAAAVALTSSAAVLLQTGWLLNTKALLPDFGRLDPRKGIKRVIGVNNLVEGGKAVVKITVVAMAVWHVVSGALIAASESLSWDLQRLVERMARDTIQVVLVVLGCQALLALLDMLWQRLRFSRQLRMSLEEVKQEQKEAEGDPRLKAKLKQIRMGRARRRMLAAVAKATVVVTNPTHYAIALAYERGSKSAPKIVAKGVDEIAARIREAAQEHRVMIVPNPPLARALYQFPLDSEVPPEHFKAVAEIIAYVWRLRSRARTAVQ